MKGAVRELRKDNKYIAKERIDEQLHRDTDRYGVCFWYALRGRLLTHPFQQHQGQESLQHTVLAAGGHKRREASEEAQVRPPVCGAMNGETTDMRVCWGRLLESITW